MSLVLKPLKMGLHSAEMIFTVMEEGLSQHVTAVQLWKTYSLCTIRF